jgi:hypothetical protein
MIGNSNNHAAAAPVQITRNTPAGAGNLCRQSRGIRFGILWDTGRTALCLSSMADNIIKAFVSKKNNW